MLGQSRGDDLARDERQFHRRREQAFLAAVVVMHQGRIHASRPGDRTDGGAVIAMLGELRAGGTEDRLAGSALPGAPAGARARVLLVPGHAGTWCRLADRVRSKNRSSSVAGTS